MRHVLHLDGTTWEVDGRKVNGEAQMMQVVQVADVGALCVGGRAQPPNPAQFSFSMFACGVTGVSASLLMQTTPEYHIPRSYAGHLGIIGGGGG